MNKIISVYFNGTSEKNTVLEDGTISLATLLHSITEHDNINRFSICVEGCGVESSDWRDLGGIFAFHLKKQVLDVAAQIEQIMRDSDADSQVNLTIFGFSRGGVAAFLLCQELKKYPIHRLKINVVAFDPVPGNSISGVYGDIFFGINSTLSASVADLTNCHNISDMLVLFTHGPLNSLMCHAPILPVHPSRCRTTVDVTLGYHQEAASFKKEENRIYNQNVESNIVFCRVVEFMEQSGIKFDFQRFELVYLRPTKDFLLGMYQGLLTHEAQYEPNNRRAMHLGNTIFTTHKRKQKFLNRYHQELSGVTPVNDQDCLLTIEKYAPKPISSMHKYMSLVMLLAIMLIILNKFSNDSDLENDLLPTPGM